MASQWFLLQTKLVFLSPLLLFAMHSNGKRDKLKGTVSKVSDEAFATWKGPGPCSSSSSGGTSPVRDMAQLDLINGIVG